MARQEFSGIVSVQQETTFLGNNSSYGTVTIGTTAKEIFVGLDKLPNRTTVFIQSHPDNDLIFIGFTPAVKWDNYGLILVGGQGIQLKVDKNNPISIYAIGNVEGQMLGVIEGSG